MKLFIVAILLAVASAAPSNYHKEHKDDYKTRPEITIVSHEDVRNPDGSSHFRFENSDYTTREEHQAQKEVSSYNKDGYNKEYETGRGNTNRGSSYHISPEGEKITLTWVADENGFQPKGDHLPVAPVYDGVPPVDDGVAPEPVALPYKRTGLGYDSKSY